MKAQHTPGPWYASISTPEQESAKWGGKCGANAAILRKTGKFIFGCETSDVIVFLPHWRDSKDNAEQIANAELIAAAPETAVERDRLKEINCELVQALEKARKLITMAATEVQRPEIIRYLSGGYKEKIEDACFKDAIGIDAIIQKAKQYENC